MWQGKGGMEGTHSMMTTIIIVVMRCRLSFAFECGVGNGGWLGFCQLIGWGVADLFVALAPPSLPSHVVHHRCSCCCRQHVSLPSDFVEHPEGTVDVPCRHRNMGWCSPGCCGWCCGCVPSWLGGQTKVARGGGDTRFVDDGSGQDGRHLFVHDLHVSSRQTPLSRLSIKTGWCELLSNIKAEFVSHHFPLCFHV